ncbi:N-acetylglucosamine-specific PTS transporter subunit IIBC [Metabacillus iocasae]|uniref:PTS system N-acetylglucosamine-specific IIC component n=1 Tax=Priestia iocasae TaxID=2291674 RepID=A0ABS2QYA7_9BACI|nr:N-acetylglucosamine-specific PTS transporter subunit IIBC [Metabacillus iocasae]MBM7703711.1 PTS system N-acetylglucosamine-specific IIC component [Metabacillus iocasae]
MLGFLQRIGRALMLPIAVLPAAALLLRLGQEDLFDIPFMAQAGDAIFANLALLFAIGVAVGIAKDGNGAAGLAGAIGYLVLTYGTAAINEKIDMAILAGIISGVVAGLLYNRFHDMKLPEWLGFFAGRRFVPIVTSITMLVLAGVFGVIWPPIQSVINGVGEWIIGAGALGVGVYGVLNRLLIPIGLHHVLNSLVWFVFGEFEGKTGDLNRFFAGDPTAGTFMTGFFPVMMFGLPAAAFAMILAAKKERRKAVASMLVGLALTSFLTGITEPIEFLFMFLSPLLYGIHALLTGLSFMIVSTLGIRHGFGFSAGALDYGLNFGIAEKPLWIIPVGLLYALLYFTIFYVIIKKFDIKTPGREDYVPAGDIGAVDGNEEEAETSVGHQFVQALGGKDNLVHVDNCITRLRLKVNDAEQVDENDLKRLGAKGVIKLNKTDVQVVIGTQVESIANEIKKYK